MPAAAIAGPMMLRMSTRNIVIGMAARADDECLQAEQKCEDEYLETAPANRFESRDAAAAAFRRCASPTSTDGQARQPEKQRRGEAAEHRRVAERRSIPRSAARVHASSVCASIIKSTARPRAQSMYARRIWRIRR